METTSPLEDLSISLKGQYDFVVTEELLQIMDSQKRVDISLKGRYDFVVTEELLHIMDSQKRVDVKWKFDDKNAKQSNRNHQLHADYKHQLEPLLPVTQKQSSVVWEYSHHFMLTPASMDASGMIGHLFILKNKTIREVL